jgi:hypothetical protein
MYRESHTPEIIDYIAYLTPSSSYLVRGDFNA